ncbi:chromate efflux transporter [Aquabacter sp. L1I39]|uniref:chromate efflux transporter n=1 Tax=Aquabacter sp. L1I39 TaxID=2820278 RepID=UPI001ADAC142|nr:chromate efflux transporter [Aquabacter sp. L1I39]QTL01582.1 chromate efflux transporter [Aquabacter sp. L1I39]
MSDKGSVAEVFRAFLALGLTSFGGPVAHLGYFRETFVIRRRWLSDPDFADLVALCQFLPGPASSQVGFALGVMRAGSLAGGIAAFIAFTLPSALALLICGFGMGALTDDALSGLIHGLKLVAVSVVAQALWGMARTLAPDGPRAGIALAGLAATTIGAGVMGQTLSIAVGAAAGLVLCRGETPQPVGHIHVPISRTVGASALILALALLVALPLLAPLGGHVLAFFEAFYRSGALVFGGGHVVLPLLQAAVVEPGWVTAPDFLAGYGLAQAVPGPLFTFAAYLGAVAQLPPNGLAGALIATLAIFLPGLLLVYGALPFWDALRKRPLAQAAMRGAGAAVVGVLAAAFYDPVWTSAIGNGLDFLLAAAGFLLLTIWRAPPWSVVALLAAAGVALH